MSFSGFQCLETCNKTKSHERYVHVKTMQEIPLQNKFRAEQIGDCDQEIVQFF